MIYHNNYIILHTYFEILKFDAILFENLNNIIFVMKYIAFLSLCFFFAVTHVQKLEFFQQLNIVLNCFFSACQLFLNSTSSAALFMGCFFSVQEKNALINFSFSEFLPSCKERKKKYVCFECIFIMVQFLFSKFEVRLNKQIVSFIEIWECK